MKSTEPNIRPQNFELSRKVSCKISSKRYSQISARGSISQSSPLSLKSALADPEGLSLTAIDTVEISVGEGTESQAFRVPRKQLCKQSAYFRNALDNEAARNLVLRGEDPLVFGLFCNWLQKQELPVKYVPNQYSDEPWRSLAAQAWVLGQHVDAGQFMHYAFCQFILNCALVDLSTWEFIEAQTQEGSSLRRFSNHWVAWNVSLAQTEYASLQASSLADQVSENTRDPRTYQTDHWNLLCGDNIGSACEHNVKAQKIANKRVKRRYSERGRAWELGQRNGSNAPSSNLPTRCTSTAPPHRLTPSPARSPSPRPASTHSFELSTTPRHQKWIVAICAILAVINLGLSAPLLPYAIPDFSISYTIVAYSIFVACLAAMLCLLHWMVWCCGYGLAWRLKLLDALYCIFSFAAAIATTVDASHCNTVNDWTTPCQIIGALSAFTWVSLYAFVALTLSAVSCL